MILDQFRLDGRRALVTGAARGIGQAIALALAEAGAEVALLDRLPLDETLRLLTGIGPRARGIPFDLAVLDRSAADELVGSAFGSKQRVDILVNNAGIIRRAEAAEQSEESWREVLQINLTSAFFLSQAVAVQLRADGRGGKVINVASMLSFQGGSQVCSYTAAKSGLAGLTRALANEWAQYGINVNAIAPGYFETEVTRGIREDAARSGPVLSRIPAGRWGTGSDIQGAAVFLASSASDYVHGAILPVDGGWLSW